MPRQSRRAWVLVISTAVVTAAVLTVVWAASPDDVRGLMLLIGGICVAGLYLALLVIQRRSHWT